MNLKNVSAALILCASSVFTTTNANAIVLAGCDIYELYNLPNPLPEPIYSHFYNTCWIQIELHELAPEHTAFLVKNVTVGHIYTDNPNQEPRWDQGPAYDSGSSETAAPVIRYNGTPELGHSGGIVRAWTWSAKYESGTLYKALYAPITAHGYYYYWEVDAGHPNGGTWNYYPSINQSQTENVVFNETVPPPPWTP